MFFQNQKHGMFSGFCQVEQSYLLCKWIIFSSKFFHVAILQRPAELLSKPPIQGEGVSDQRKVTDLGKKKKKKGTCHYI